MSLERRIASLETGAPGRVDGPVVLLAEDLGNGRYRCTSDGTVYDAATLPRGTVLILRERIVEAGHES